MGASLSQHIENFTDFTQRAYEIKSRDLNQYTRNLKRSHLWADLESRDRNERHLGELVRELVRTLDLNRNDTYLVGGTVSKYYEDLLSYYESDEVTIERNQYKERFLAAQIEIAKLKSRLTSQENVASSHSAGSNPSIWTVTKDGNDGAQETYTIDSTSKTIKLKVGGHEPQNDDQEDQQKDQMVTQPILPNQSTGGSSSMRKDKQKEITNMDDLQETRSTSQVTPQTPKPSHKKSLKKKKITSEKIITGFQPPPE